jgi:hypothetical protein
VNFVASQAVNRTLPREAGSFFTNTVDSLENEIHARSPGSTVLIENTPFADPWTRELVPGVAAVFLIHFPNNEVDGRRVHFTENDPERLAYWMHYGGPRLRDLLIAPGPRQGLGEDRSRGDVGGR